MSNNNEIYLGITKQVRKLDLNSGKNIWTKVIKGDPIVLTPYHNYLLVQSRDGWGKCFLHCLKAETGEVLWNRKDYNIMVLHFLEDGLFFLEKKVLTKISLESGRTVFEQKIKSPRLFHSGFNLLISGDNLYLVSVEKSYQVDTSNGSLKESEIFEQKADLKGAQITSVCGDNMDMLTNVTRIQSDIIASQSSDSNPGFVG